jgi:cephalosporin hydroxylase
VAPEERRVIGRRGVSLPDTDLDVAASCATFDDESRFTQAHEGLRVWKTVDDMARYRAVIEATRPEVVIEAGTKWGGFAAWLADTCRVEVIAVDIERAEGRPDSWPGVTFVVEGSSIELDVVTRVRELAAGRRTMVTLDSDHHAPHVSREIRAYGPLVSRGCYLVVEDGIADLAPYAVAEPIGRRIPKTGGPLWSIARELVGNDEWIRDREIENMTSVSHHPAGWWRRAARPER